MYSFSALLEARYSRLQLLFANKRSRLVAIAVVVIITALFLLNSTSAVTQFNPMTQGSCALTASCKKRAISTILTGPSFLPGIVTLSYSISKHAPNVDKLIIVPNAWSDHHITSDHLQMLQRTGYQIKFFDDLPLPISEDQHDSPMSSRFADLLLKLHGWSLIEYSSMALLDADILLNDSLTYPLDLLEASTANLAAVAAPSSSYGEPAFDMLAGHFNAGVLFFKPDLVVFSSLVAKSSRREEYATMELAEQSFLNTLYSGNYLSLPVRYNTANLWNRKEYFKHFLVDTNWDFGILHFLGNLKNKPWSGTMNSDNDAQKGVELWKEEYRQAREAFKLEEADIM